jgi:hypothetical protein
MAGGLIGKVAKQAIKKSGKKTPNKKTRIAKNKRKNIKKANDAEDRHWAGLSNPTKPSTQSQKKRAKAKAKSDYKQKQRKADRKDDQAFFKKYGQKVDIPF